MIVSLFLLNRTTNHSEFIGHAKTLEEAHSWYKKAIDMDHPIFKTHYPLAESVMLLTTEMHPQSPGFHQLMDAEEVMEQIEQEVIAVQEKARNELDIYRNNVEPKILIHDSTITSTIQ